MSGIHASLLEQQLAFKRTLHSQPLLESATSSAAARAKLSGETAGSSQLLQQQQQLSGKGAKRPQVLESNGRVFAKATGGTRGRPVQADLYDVLSLLKETPDSLTAEDILVRKGIDIYASEELFRLITTNEKVIFVDERFQYKPDYDIKNKEELLEYLLNNRMKGGLDIRDLKECHFPVTQAVESLKKENKINVIQIMPSSTQILFYRDNRFTTPIDPKFKEIWDSIKVPDETEMEKEFQKAGLKSMDVINIKIAKAPIVKPKRGRARKLKIMNTHLENIDLTKDYVLPKK